MILYSVNFQNKLSLNQFNLFSKKYIKKNQKAKINTKYIKYLNDSIVDDNLNTKNCTYVLDFNELNDLT